MKLIIFPLPFIFASAVSVASAQYITPQTAFDAGGTLNGTTFINNGLVGAGRLSGNLLDVFGETLGAASGLSISNWSHNGSNFSGTFNVLPDRGFNAGTFFSNYGARLHEVAFTFTPYTGAAQVGQTQIVPTYSNSSTKFTYLDGASTKFTSGLIPTGTSTILGQTLGTVTAANGPGGASTNLISFDAEAVHLFTDGSGYVSDEYGTYIARFDSSKQITNIVQLPASARPTNALPGAAPNFGATNTLGRNANQGLEGLSVSPDGTRLFALMQSALVQDATSSQQTRLNTRLFVYDISTPALKETPSIVGEYAVQLPTIDRDGTGGAIDRTAAQSEIVAISNTQFTMLARDGNGLGNGDTRPAVFKSVSLVDFSGATNILGTYDATGNQISPGGVLIGAIVPASSTEVVNLIASTDLAKFGYNTNNTAKDINTFSEKWEGMSLVPDISTADPNDYFLFVANDNDFQSTNVKMLDASGNIVSPVDATTDSGVVNDAHFLAYSVTIIPEPSSSLLILLSGLGLVARRRR